MAIAFHGSTPTLAHAGATTTVTTSNFTPPAGSFLVVSTGSGGSGRTVSVSSSNGLTFTQRASKTNTGNYSFYIYTAPVVSSTSMNVTTTFNTGTSVTTKVWVITGADNSTVGSTFSGPASSTTANPWSTTAYTSTVDGSMMVFAGGASGAGTLSSSDTYETDNTNFDSIHGHKASVTSPAGSSVSLDITGSTSPSASWQGVAVEIIPSTQTVSPTGIASAEAFGTAKVNLSIAATGITSGEAFGSAVISYNQTVSPAGIASGEAFGTAQLNLNITTTGIASSEAFGSTLVISGLVPTGIPSAEAFGLATIQLEQIVSLTGIPSAQAFGTAVIRFGFPQDINPSGIPSAEAFGYLETRLRSRYVLVTDGVQETPAALNKLHIRYGIHRGISILRRADGSYVSVRYPSLTEIEESLAYYRGGGRHWITAQEAADLQAAGYGSLIHLELIE